MTNNQPGLNQEDNMQMHGIVPTVLLLLLLSIDVNMMDQPNQEQSTTVEQAMTTQAEALRLL
jgi:hypothetical protein